MTTHAQKTAIHVDASDETPVLFSDENEDRFVLSCREAVRAAQVHVGINVIHEELRGVMAHVRAWLTDHADDVRHCFIMPRGGHMVVFVSPRGEQYDEDLAEELTELDLDIAEKFQFCPCEVVQIPGDGENLSHFVDEDRALKMKAPDERSQGTARAT